MRRRVWLLRPEDGLERVILPRVERPALKGSLEVRKPVPRFVLVGSSKGEPLAFRLVGRVVELRLVGAASLVDGRHRM